MRSLRTLLPVALLGLWSASAIRAQGTMPVNDTPGGVASARSIITNDVRLGVAVAEETGGRPALRVSLFNRAGDGIWVNKRMDWNVADASPGQREIRVEIRDEQGRVLPFSCKKRGTNAIPADYVLLRGGQFAGSIVFLDLCADMRQPGRYKVVVRYHDTAAPLDLKPPFPRFDKEIVSSAVEVIVEGSRSVRPVGEK